MNEMSLLCFNSKFYKCLFTLFYFLKSICNFIYFFYILFLSKYSWFIMLYQFLLYRKVFSCKNQVRWLRKGKAMCHRLVLACWTPEKLPMDHYAKDKSTATSCLREPSPVRASLSNTPGEKAVHLMSVSGNWLFQRKSRWITYFQLVPWEGRSIMLKPK